MEAEKNEGAPVTARREFEGHTPGPWEASERPIMDREANGNPWYTHRIVPPLGHSGPVALVSEEANAALIAAAPALLRERDELRAALEAYVAYYHGTRELDPDISSDRLGIAARAALSAARS